MGIFWIKGDRLADSNNLSAPGVGPMHQTIENLTYEELSVGQTGQLLRTLTVDDVRAFAAVSGDNNPAHLDPEYAADTMFHGVIAHGMWGASLISALLGTRFPGPGTIYLHQDLHFSRPVHIGDTLTVTAAVLSKEDPHNTVVMDCRVVNQEGAVVVHGNARVMVPTKKVRRMAVPMPHIQLVED